MAWRQSPGGSEQHLTRAAAAARTRTQRPGKHLAVHASELVVKPDFQILRRYRRPLLLRLEHTHRPTLEDYVHRATRLGSSRSLNLRIGISHFFWVSSRSPDAIYRAPLRSILPALPRLRKETSRPHCVGRSCEQASRGLSAPVRHRERCMLIGLERDLLCQHNVADGKAPLRPEAPDGDLHIVLVEFVNVHLTTVADAIVLPAVAAGHIEVPRALVTLM